MCESLLGIFFLLTFKVQGRTYPKVPISTKIGLFLYNLHLTIKHAKYPKFENKQF